MQLTTEALDLIKQWEGLRLEAYQCQAGVWTIGYGHTKGVRPGDTCTKEKAEIWLREDVGWAEAAVRDLVTVPLTDNQFGALVSFTFNLGRDNLEQSTLLKRLNAGEYAAVPGELAKWNKVRQDGKLIVSDGLVNRRAAEAGLWARGAHVAGRDVPAVPVPAPKAFRPEVIGPVAAALATALTQLGGLGGPVVWAVAAVVIAGAGFGIWYGVRRAKAAT